MRKDQAKRILTQFMQNVEYDMVDYQDSGENVEQARDCSKSKAWQKMITRALQKHHLFEYGKFRKAKLAEIKKAMHGGTFADAQTVQYDMNQLDAIEYNGGQEFGIVEDVDPDDAKSLFDIVGSDTTDALMDVYGELRAKVYPHG